MAKKKGISVEIPERYARILRMLTHESNLELAIAIMLKQIVHYRLKDALSVIKTFEGRYRKVIAFNRRFHRHWEEGAFPNEAVFTSYEEIASGKPPSQ